MIIGIGTDLCDVRRIEKTLNRFGDRFTGRIYTQSECKKAASRSNPAVIFAVCFAAKESCVKALGTGFRNGICWSDIGVSNHPSGQPFLELSGGAMKQLLALTPDHMEAQINLTLSDEYPMAQAMVVISANPISEAP